MLPCCSICHAMPCLLSRIECSACCTNGHEVCLLTRESFVRYHAPLDRSVIILARINPERDPSNNAKKTAKAGALVASMVGEVHRDFVRCEKPVHHPALKQPVVSYLFAELPRLYQTNILKPVNNAALQMQKLSDQVHLKTDPIPLTET